MTTKIKDKKCTLLKGAVMAMQLRVFFFEKMNLKYPGLEKVEKCYLDGNLDGAETEYLKFRRDIVEKKNIVHPYFCTDMGDPFTWSRIEIKHKNPRDYAKFLQEIEPKEALHKETIMDWANENYDQSKKDGGWGDWRFDHARAYILAHKFTKDDKYIERGVAELRCLLNTLSFERGINNGLDVLTPGIWAGRTLPDAYFGFLNHKAMTPQEHTMIVEGYTRLVDALFCDGTVMKLNHVQNMFTTAAFGLFKASVIFPEFRNSPRWREQSLQWIKEIADNHIFDDGAWEEVSQNYSYVIFVDFSKFIELCRANKIGIEPLIEQKYMLFAEFLNKVVLPSGVLAIFGHSLEANHINFVRRFFELAYPEKCSDDRFKLHKKSTHFSDARMVIMRNGDDENQRFMMFDYGPEWSHTDNDCLGISLFAYKEYLIPNIGDMGVELPRLASRLLVNGVGLGEGRAGEVSLENDVDYASASKQL